METKEAAEEEDDVDDGDGYGYDDGEIRVLDDVIVRNEIDDDDEVIEGDLKTMKEIIEMELHNKRRNLMDAASVFTQKWRKWRQKQKEKKQSRCINGEIGRSKLGQTSQFRDSQSEVADYGLGRRSCDTEPRFSIDAAHRLSVEEPRFSFDEHRASWDGYMMARTIPRLTPMLSAVDNMMLGSKEQSWKKQGSINGHQWFSAAQPALRFSFKYPSSTTNGRLPVSSCGGEGGPLSVGDCKRGGEEEGVRLRRSCDLSVQRNRDFIYEELHLRCSYKLTF
ncbi:hypothetical protein L1987_82483 [Smallanthus sonchifolius]|uniref:Uncharacterized protein n=1 Tax=Smallanthus sonchifolius TaxID=185202 RepID=A0ACB8YBA1_9ASTR|nr:hypothetical protein L1987_82483 [Smallanthus sonchifolius]